MRTDILVLCAVLLTASPVLAQDSAPSAITSGSADVLVDGLPLARSGDVTTGCAEK